MVAIRCCLFDSILEEAYGLVCACALSSLPFLDLSALCVMKASRRLCCALNLARCAGEAQMLHLILAVAARSVVVPVISNSVFQIRRQLPRYKDTAPFSDVSIVLSAQRQKRPQCEGRST